MKRLIIDAEAGELKILNKQLIGENFRVPLKLFRLLMITETAIIPAKTALDLARNGIGALIMSKDSRSFALLVPQRAKNTDLKIGQYRALDRREEFARQLVAQKIAAHKTALENLGLSLYAEDFHASLQRAEEIENIVGVEGAMSAAFFERFFTLFKRPLSQGFRSRQPPKDPLNAMLSFVYTLIYHNIAARLYLSGIDPAISYLHTPFRDHYALASDLMEPLRADASVFAGRLFLDGHLSADDFNMTKSACYLKWESRRKLWVHLRPFLSEQDKAIKAQIASLRKFLRYSPIEDEMKKNEKNDD